MAWQKLSVELKGEAEPIVVQTMALDWAPVVMDPAAPKAMDMMFQVAHNALRRVGASVPRDYRGFLEVLDGVPTALEDTDADMDPTNAAATGTVP